MLNFSNIINQMTLEDKLKLIIKSNPKELYGNEENQIPSLFPANFLDYIKEFDFYDFLANSFDLEKAYELGYYCGKMALSEGYNALYGPKITLREENPEYRSDHILVTERLVSEFFKGAKDTGIFTIIKVYANEITNKTLSNVLKEEYYVKTLKDILAKGSVDSICFSKTSLEDSNYLEDVIEGKWNYKGLYITETKNVKDALTKIKEGYHIVISENTDTVKYVLECVKDDKDVLDIIDNNLDSLISYLLNAKSTKGDVSRLKEINPNLLDKAASKSSVLLKNNEILPIKNNVRFLFIGSTLDGLSKADEEMVFKNSLGHLEITPDNLVEIENQAKRANYIIFYPSLRTELIYEVLEEIKRHKLPIIFVTKDIKDLDNYNLSLFDSIIYLNGSAGTLKDILYNTYPYGYLGLNSKLPFGYSLDFTKSYAHNFFLDEKKVSFTFENKSDKELEKLICLFVTDVSDDTNHLKDFKLIKLEPNESKIVTFNFSKYTFAKFDENTLSYVVLPKKHTLAIGYDSKDIIYSKTLNPFDLTHYSETEEYNQKLNQQVMAYKMTSDSKKNGLKFSTKILILLICLICLVSGTLLSVYGMMESNLDELYTYVSIGASSFLLLILIILFAKAFKGRKNYYILNGKDIFNEIEVMPCDNYDHELRKIKVEDNLEVVNNSFEDIEFSQPSETTKEFDLDEEERKSFEIYEELKEEPVEYVSKVDLDKFDENMSLEDACNEFRKYTLSLGLDVEYQTIRALISGILSSRCLILKHDPNGLNKEVIKALSNFLQSGYSLQVMKDSYENKEDIFKRRTKAGMIVPSAILNGILYAHENRSCITLDILDNVNLGNMDYFRQFIPYLRAQNEKYGIRVGNDFKNKEIIDGKIQLPINLWFILILNEDSKLDMNSMLYSNALVIDIYAKEVEPVEPDEEIKTINYDFVTERSYNLKNENSSLISEELFKKLDEFEQLLHERNGFVLTPRVSCLIELFSSAYLDSGTQEEEALDMALCAILLNFLKADERLKEGENSLSLLLDQAFGLDYTTFSQKTIKD